MARRVTRNGNGPDEKTVRRMRCARHASLRLDALTRARCMNDTATDHTPCPSSPSGTPSWRRRRRCSRRDRARCARRRAALARAPLAACSLAHPRARVLLPATTTAPHGVHPAARAPRVQTRLLTKYSHAKGRFTLKVTDNVKVRSSSEMRTRCARARTHTHSGPCARARGRLASSASELGDLTPLRAPSPRPLARADHQPRVRAGQ